MRVAGIALLAALALVATLPAQQPTKDQLLAAIEKQLKAASESAGPCVGCVVVSKSDRYPKPVGAGDQPGKLGAYDIKEFLKLNNGPGDARLGVSLDLSDPNNTPNHACACGVVIDPSGLILTPYHVVEGATKVFVHLPGKTGSYADIHAADSRHDLAVLKLINPPQQLTAIKFADVRLDLKNVKRPTVAQGSLVVLMSNVYVTGFVLDKPSAALGNVSKIQQAERTEKEQSVTYYQYGPLLEVGAVGAAVPLPAGVDGAAVLNLDGEMIGLATSSVLSPSEKYTAFPADPNFRRVVDALRRGEEVDYGYLGITLNTARQQGLQITSVISRGPAAQAGIHGSTDPDLADTITKVNGVELSTYEELLWHVGSALAGNKVKLTVTRGNRERDVEVVLGKFAHKLPSIASVRPDPVFGLRVDYGSILAQPQQPGDVRASVAVPDGVSVREVAPNSQAAAAFKKLGDRPERWLITQVNGAAVSTPAEFYKAAKGQPSIKLTVRDPAEPNPRDREVSFP